MNPQILTEKFGHIHHLTRRALGKRRLEEGGVTSAQKRILAALKLQDGLPTRDLAFILGIRVTSLNESLVKLESLGLITREKSASDGRVMLVSLTEAGRSSSQDETPESGMFTDFTADELEQLGGFLDRVIVNLEKETEGFDDRDLWARAARERMGDDRFDEWMARAEKMGMRTHGAGRRGFGRGHRGGRGRSESEGSH